MIKPSLGRAAILPAFCLFIFLFCETAVAQSLSPAPASTPEATPTPGASLEKKFFHNILSDQRAIWTAPFRLNSTDAKWAIPLTVSFAALLATDSHTSGELVENGDNPDRMRISKDISYLGSAYVTGGVALGFYLAGRAGHNARARETGLLAGEALLNGAIVGGVLKAASQRERPPDGNNNGTFFVGGSSFPSGHSIAAWSVATIIAQEYGRHRPLVKIAAYGLATAVSISRYTGRNHFLSDVLIGSAIGYGIGRCVYHRRHDSSLDSDAIAPKVRHSHSKLFPGVTPLYSPRARAYGVAMAWSL
jgi:hypothetical protein